MLTRVFTVLRMPVIFYLLLIPQQGKAGQREDAIELFRRAAEKATLTPW